MACPTRVISATRVGNILLGDAEIATAPPGQVLTVEGTVLTHKDGISISTPLWWVDAPFSFNQYDQIDSGDGFLKRFLEVGFTIPYDGSTGEPQEPDPGAIYQGYFLVSDEADNTVTVNFCLAMPESSVITGQKFMYFWIPDGATSENDHSEKKALYKTDDLTAWDHVVDGFLHTKVLDKDTFYNANSIWFTFVVNNDDGEFYLLLEDNTDSDNVKIDAFDFAGNYLRTVKNFGALGLSGIESNVWDLFYDNGKIYWWGLNRSDQEVSVINTDGTGEALFWTHPTHSDNGYLFRAGSVFVALVPSTGTDTQRTLTPTGTDVDGGRWPNAHPLTGVYHSSSGKIIFGDRNGDEYGTVDPTDIEDETYTSLTGFPQGSAFPHGWMAINGDKLYVIRSAQFGGPSYGIDVFDIDGSTGLLSNREQLINGRTSGGESYFVQSHLHIISDL